MDGDALNQAGVQDLLKAMAAAPEVVVASAPAAQVPLLPKTPEKIIPYDFKRPERVGKEQMRALQALHEGFGRNFAAGLSSMLRSTVEVKLTRVDQLTYTEFVLSLENPTCFNLLKADPLEGNLILEINPAILYPIIDRLLGGGREVDLLARRPLTEIELRVVSRITGLFLDELRRAWENVLELRLGVIRVESDPQSLQIVPPNEVVVVVRFEIALGETRGMVNLCIPYHSIEQVVSRLSANRWVSWARKAASPESAREIGQALRGSLVSLHVRLAETRISTGDLIGLRVGDIITTEKDIRRPLTVSVEGIPKFRANPGLFKGHKAIRVEEVIANPVDAVGE